MLWSWEAAYHDRAGNAGVSPAQSVIILVAVGTVAPSAIRDAANQHEIFVEPTVALEVFHGVR